MCVSLLTKVFQSASFSGPLQNGKNLEISGMISELQVVTSTSDEQIQEKSMCCCISIMSSNLKYVNYFKWMIFKKI